MFTLIFSMFFVVYVFLFMSYQSKNKTAILFILLGLITGILLSLFLPEEKLIIAMSAPTALIGAGCWLGASHLCK